MPPSGGFPLFEKEKSMLPKRKLLKKEWSKHEWLIFSLDEKGYFWGEVSGRVGEYETSRLVKSKQLSVKAYLCEIHFYTKFEKLKQKSKTTTHKGKSWSRVNGKNKNADKNKTIGNV